MKDLKIYGEKGGGGGGHTFYEDPNNLKSVSTVKVLDLISEGEIVGLVDGAKSIFLDDVSVLDKDGKPNFGGLKIEMNNGTPDQSYLNGFSKVETFYGVGVQVKHNFPVIKSFDDPNANGVIVTMSFPSLNHTNKSNGDLLAHYVSFMISLRADEGVWHDSDPIIVSGKCVSEFQRSYYFTLPSSSTGKYDIKVTRISEDSTVSTDQSDTRWFGFTAVIESRLNYANHAICGLTVRADQFGSNVPTRKYEVYGLIIKVPSNYDAWNHTYSGIWDGTFKRSWSNNPAWVFYDLLTNGRYGLGRDIQPEYIDKYGLYMIGKYCDELVPDGKGGMEPRFTFNGTINTREAAYSLLNNIAGMFNSMIYYSGNAIVPIQDSPKTPVRDFSPANVIDGLFSYEGTGRSARHSVFQTTWSNPETKYDPDVEVVENPEMIQDLGWKVSEITLLGCTSRGQARRRALRDIYTEAHETETVTFAVTVENADIAPGDIIRIFDPNYAGYRYAGRIVDVQDQKITLDSEIDFGSATFWKAGFILPDNTWLDAEVENPHTTTNVISLTAPLEKYPEVGSVWSMQSDQVEPRLFRVLAIKEEKPYQFNITALLHYNQKYDVIEKGVEFVDGAFSRLPSGAIKAPKQIAAEQYLHRVGDGVEISIITSWQNDDPRATVFCVRYKEPNSTIWTELGYTSSETAVISNTHEGQYTIQVQALDGLGRKSAWTEFKYDAAGYNIIPSNISGIRHRISSRLGIFWEWDKCTDFDFRNYVFRGSNEPVDYSVSTAEHRTLPYNFTGDFTAQIWAQNLAGNLSLVPATEVIKVLPPKKCEVLSAKLLNSGIVATWKDAFQMFDVSLYRITTCRGLESQLALNTNITFAKPSIWLKGDVVQVQAQDVFNNWGEISNPVSITWYAPQTPKVNINYNALTGAIVLDWQDCTYQIEDAPAIAYYKITGTLAQSTEQAGVISTLGTHFESIVPLDAYEYGTQIENGVEIEVGTLTVGVVAVDKYGITSEDADGYVDNTQQFSLYPPYLPTNMSIASTSEGDAVVLSWKDCQRTFAIDYYLVYDQFTKKTYKVSTNYVVLPARKEGSYRVTIQAFDVIGHSSPVSEYNMLVGGVGGMMVTAGVDGSDILIQWSIPDASFILDHYIIKSDNFIPEDPSQIGFDDGTLLGTAKVNYFRIPAGKAGDYTFYIWAVDVAGNISSNYASYASITITAPSAPELFSESTGTNIRLKWIPSIDSHIGQLPIISYDVTRYWMDSTTGIDEAHEYEYGNFTQDTVDVAPLSEGKYYFRVRAWDTGGNHSDAWGESEFIVNSPNAPFFNEVQVIVNAVMFWWSEPKVTTFNIARYKMYEIEDGIPMVIGETDALYATRSEAYNGKHIYGISAVDLAGNESPMALTTQEVDSPTGFILYWDKNSLFTGEKNNFVLDGHGNMLGPLLSDETWDENIVRMGLGSDVTWNQKRTLSEGWSGPRVDFASYEETIDVGTEIPTTRVAINVSRKTLEGDPILKCYIATSKDGVTWSDWNESFQMYALQFRFIKYRLECTNGVISISNINYKLDLQRKQDFFTSKAYAKDCYVNGDIKAGVLKAPSEMGTWVPFGVEFTDVEVPITAEPVDKSTGLNPMIIFNDVKNPDGFRLVLFDKTGTPVDGDVHWVAFGV